MFTRFFEILVIKEYNIHVSIFSEILQIIHKPKHFVNPLWLLFSFNRIINERDINIVNIFPYFFNVSEAIFRHQHKYNK